MRSNQPGEQQTYLARNRRAQLVVAAIEVIAERGYANTSLADVAQRAGTSKGVLLYHFAGKDDLISQVVAEIFDVAATVVGPEVRAAVGARAKLAGYIRARIGFLSTHRPYMQALLDIWLGYRDPDGHLRLDAEAAEPALTAIEDLLRAGRSEGVFRAFPTRPMAVAIGQAIDGVLLQLIHHPDLDLDEYAAEIVTIFDLATRSTP